MKTFRTIFILTILSILIVYRTNGQNLNSVYQAVLSDFYNQYLNEKLFQNECTGLKYNPKLQILINTDSIFEGVENYTVKHVFGLKTYTFVKDSVGWEWIYQQMPIKNIQIDLNKFPKFEQTDLIKALPSDKSDKYLLRLSSPNVWKEHAFIEIWIKLSDYTSGTRILYMIDNNGNIINSKMYSYCDDNG